jgi:hypothetical protein
MLYVQLEMNQTGVIKEKLTSTDEGLSDTSSATGADTGDGK